MIEAILSDMDGTLIDTEIANASAYCYAIAQYGGAITVEDFQQNYAGMSWKAFLPIILPDASDETHKAIADLKKSKYVDFFPSTTLYTDVLDFLTHSKQFAPVALVTTASRQAVDGLLRYHGLENFFDAIVSGDDVVNAKPHAEPYLAAATMLGVNIANCIALEDSQVGINSATSARANVFIVKHEK
ncbi:HAD family phosphatase [Kosakonia sacchari]|uniref:HAD family hydrolase n=1 Tax=Kosakonia TaxID=1330547 RepID=UPI00190DFB90|nr:HAD family phosphatase [Kosakonia sp. LAM2021]